MKWYLLLIIISLLGNLVAYAGSELNLAQVNVTCPASEACSVRKNGLENLVGSYRSLIHLKNTLRLMASDGGYQSFYYDLERDEGKYKLNIRLILKPIISDINIGFTDRNLTTDPMQLITLRQGEFFEEQKLRDNIEALHTRLDSLGYPKNSNTLEVIHKNQDVRINLVITLGPPRIFKKIKTDATSSFVNDYLIRKFVTFYNKPFEFNRFKLFLDDAQRELFSYGYYLVNLDFSPIVKGNRVILDIKVTNDKMFAFDFRGIKEESREAIHSLVRDLFRKYKRPLPEPVIRSAIQEHYLNRAHLNVTVDIETSKHLNMYKENVTLYKITISEKFKTKLTNVSFTGNTFFSQKKLKKMFDKEAFELASIDYFDQEYFNYFVGYLKSIYIKNGFVQVKIQGPIKTMDTEKKFVSVEYIIQEGPRAFIRSLQMVGMPEEFEEKVAAALENKVGLPFNPLIMTDDVKKAAGILQENGYYFAEITNANDENLVAYSRSGTDVDIKLLVNPGPVVRLNRVLILGNHKTKKIVILKKVLMKNDDLITPAKTYDIESRLSATGLFNAVTVSPMKHSSKNASTDLIVKVIERDYGLVEIAPGYRTDIGLKLTGTVSYVNIGGMNRSLTLRSQVNKRISYVTFDARRRKEKKQMLEHNTSLTYTQGDIWDTLIDSSSMISFQRKRFYSFDADIFRLSNTFTRDLTKQLSSSLRYQYEAITQWDATEVRDRGSFKIGAITPTLTYDLRNSLINPVKGAFFNLSCEFANPYFLSQKDSDVTIDYYKLISRNRFYIPFKNGTVAISLVGGVQENLAKNRVRDANGQPVLIDGRQQTEGYIPNIKVFRLTGMDIIRGFTDQEANQVGNKKDISTVRIQDKAFLANFKLEPRYFMTDNLIGGVFLDAGRVYVDQVDLGELRSSAGVTFKILTPVGTLDFDYGIKLLRKRNADGSLEDPGRFHVSIGFF